MATFLDLNPQGGSSKKFSIDYSAENHQVTLVGTGTFVPTPSSGGNNIFSLPISIAPSDWIENDGIFSYTYRNENITSATICLFANASVSGPIFNADLNYETANGMVIFSTTERPTKTLEDTLILLITQEV